MRNALQMFLFLLGLPCSIIREHAWKAYYSLKTGQAACRRRAFNSRSANLFRRKCFQLSNDSFGHNYSAMPLQRKCFHRQYSKEWLWLWYNGPQAVFCQPLGTWSIIYITLMVCPLFFLCKTPTLNLSNYQFFYR